MPILSKPSAGAGVAVGYITVGALLDVWAGVWYWWLSNNPPKTNLPYYLCIGFLLTGVVLVVLGLAIGKIGRAARQAELPPEEVTPTMAQTDNNVVTPTAFPMYQGMPAPSPGAVPPAPAPGPVPYPPQTAGR